MAPYVRKSRRVLELAAGPRAKKAVDLALRRSKTEITAIDLRKDVNYARYLKEKGIHFKPKNLDIKANTDAEGYLKRQKGNHFDHIYAHFLFQHLTTAKRAATFAQIWRTLRPGGTFLAIGEDPYSQQQALELQRQGFRVSIRPVSRKEMEKLDTDYGRHNLWAEEQVERLIKKTMQEDPSGELAKSIFLQAGRISLNRELKEIGEELGTEPAKSAYKKMLRDSSRIRLYERKRFFAIWAKKPRIRYVGPEGASTTTHKKPQ